MNIRKIIFYLLILLLPAIISCVKQTEVKSPDGKIAVKVGLSETGNCNFSVFINGEAAVENSPLGILLNKEGLDFSSGLELIQVSQKVVNEEYTMLVGKHFKRKNHCTEC